MSTKQKINEILSKRTDLSRFLVHLTRDKDGNTAKENLISILSDREITAFNHNNYFSPLLRNESDDIQERFHVLSFTETPLDKIHLLTTVPNRNIILKPYGLVFTKDMVRKARANPAIYVYDDNKLMIRFLKDKYKDFLSRYKDDDELDDFFTLGSMVNIVKEGHDFHWEREWRVRKRFRFLYKWIFAVIAPENEHQEIRDVFQDELKYIPFIDANWNMEEILENIAEYMWSNLQE